MDLKEEDQRKSKKIIQKAKKPNGFKKSKSIKSKPKKADNEDDNEDEDDVDEEEENDLLEKQKEKLQVKFIECINSYNTYAISECISFLEDLPFEVIEYVLIKTSGINHPNWNYAKKILNDYVEQNIDSLEKININQKEGKKELAGEWEDD